MEGEVDLHIQREKMNRQNTVVSSGSVIDLFADETTAP